MENGDMSVIGHGRTHVLSMSEGKYMCISYKLIQPSVVQLLTKSVVFLRK